MAAEITATNRGMKVYVTPTDKIKFRQLSKEGMIRSISPTSDLMAMVPVDKGERSWVGKCVLYDLKTDTIKAELGDNKAQTQVLSELNPQWTADGRYLYMALRKDENSHRPEVLTRIWDIKAGKEVSIISGVAPVGPGPGNATMVLASTPGKTPAGRDTKDKPGIVLHIQGDETLHPLGDKHIRPISTQGKWLLFIRRDAEGKETACMAEIVLPKKAKK